MAKRRRSKNKRKATIFIIIALAVIFTILGVTLQQMLTDILIAVGVAILLGLVIGILNLPVVKGKRGEHKIARLLESLSKKLEAYVINDVIVAVEDGKTSQIDHILFARGGIFVIETKNYSGRIYGSESQREWTQVLAYGRTKNKLYNPVKQNQTHIYRLKEILGKQLPFISCVVFLRADISYIDSDLVYTPSELKRFLRENAFKEESTNNSVQDAYNKIITYKEKPIQTTKEHVQEIKKTLSNIDDNICPRCGGTLVLRKGASGSFYGCSNYPKCRFTKKA